MRSDPAIPENELDRCARAAFQKCAGELGSHGLAQMFGVARRTVERIQLGKRDVPPGLARQMADRIEEIGASVGQRHAGALRAWADSRERADG